MGRLKLRYAPRYSHHELVLRATRWLSGTNSCRVVWDRPTILTDEIPDAIGWTPLGTSIVVECKASRGDFRRDREKWHRKLSGMGNRRYFMASIGVIPIEELPPAWGLLECHRHKVVVVREATNRNHSEKDFASEARLLIRAVSLELDRGEYQWMPDIGL